MRIAVESGLFPVYEVFDGERYRVNIEPDGSDPAEYFHRQRRFKDDDIDLDTTRRECVNRTHRLRLLANEYPV